MVDSTALSTRIDPEDFRDVISACHRSISDAVTRFGGFVARYVGDAAMALFGYPDAHEDDADRAVHAALAAVQAVQDLRVLHGTYKPSIRVGIATGLAVVGDLLGSGTDVAGETPNLAARLHTMAGPGEIIIASTTRRLLHHPFEFHQRGDVHLKGFDEPIGIASVVGANPHGTSHKHSRVSLSAMMLGRTAERAILHGRWARAQKGEGQVVLITGEAGIGKTRLSAAFQDDIAEDQHVRLRYFCSPYHVNSALQPVVTQIERAARFNSGDSADARMRKLEDLLDEPKQQPDTVAAIADLLSIRETNVESPQQRKERTLQSLLAQFRVFASKNTILLTVEDAHWSDPTSRELLEQTVAAVRELRVMLLIAARPEFVPTWLDQPHVSHIELTRFDRGETGELIRQIAHGKAMPAHVFHEIAVRSDGVPLFIEEMTKAVLASGLLIEHEDYYELSGQAVSVEIPDTLNASLMARLGRPSVMRELALIGATIGRDFSYEMLAAVTQHPEPVLQEALRNLMETELVYMRSRPPNAVYSFKHALVRDAAYGLLLRDRRRELHARIAEVLQTRFPDTVERQPELLAHHHTAAGNLQSAVRSWVAAATRAADRWAMAEAVAHAEKALEVLGQLPDNEARWRRELPIVMALGNALIASRGYTAPRTGEVYERARALCEALGDTANLIRVGNGQWSFHLMRSEIKQAQAVADDYLRRYQQNPTPEMALAAHRLVGTSLLQVGRLADGQRHLEDAQAVLKDASPDMVGARDAHVAVPAYLSIILALRGRYDEAYRQRALALDAARQTKNPYRLAFAMGVAAIWFNVVMDDGLVDFDSFLNLTVERDFPFWRGFGVAHRGLARARAGDIHQGTAMVREGELLHRAMGTYWGIPQSLGTLAQHLPPAEGLEMAENALRDLDATGVRWFAPELMRIKGSLQVAAGDHDAAEATYRAALTESEAQDSRHWQLRIVLSMATVWRRLGRTDEIAQRLDHLCGSFAEQQTPKELRAARSLLADLRRPGEAA
ncbi:MAG: adenylate/guanylate cyclase domain-containing protein [Acetobacteraceae bacterium]